MARTCVLAASALAVVLAGCGDDDGDTGGGDVSEEAQPYVDALVESAADNEGGDIPFGEEQAECVAPEWVEILDPAELEAAGITPQELAERDEVMNEVDLTEDDGAAMYDALVECDVDVRSSIVASMGEDSELSEEDRQCLEDAFDDDMLRDMFAVVLSQGEDALRNDEEMVSQLAGVFSECPGALPND